MEAVVSTLSRYPSTNMKNWFALWARSMDIAMGAPEVIAHRLALFHRMDPWAPATMLEAQHMVLEKMQASQEAWWVWYQEMLKEGTRQAFNPEMGLHASSGHQATQRALATMHRSLKPISRRVSANVKRLRSR